MLFNSYEFILAAFPISLLVYYGLIIVGKKSTAQGWLISFSLFFYGFFNWSYLLIICSSILFNFLFARLIRKCNRYAKFLMTVGIVANVALIFVYKYFDFFINNVNAIFNSSIELLHLLLPLGISFFTFQQISYLVDTYKGKTEKDSFLDYALFVSFFPQLIAGPIVLREEMIPQFHDDKRKRFSVEYFAEGMYFFSLGLAKKVLIADTLAKGVDWGYSNIQTLSGLSALLISILYSFQLYFDFSGYCDMARGIANCFHIDIPQNFNSPYKANSIDDFWKRWHMSLTRFLTNYVYIPLGGSRKGKTRTLINIILVFLVSGIWHGAGWTFVCWGLLHGVASVIHRLIETKWEKIYKPLACFITFAFCNLTWIFFRANSISDALTVICKICTPNQGYFTVPYELTQKFITTESQFLINHISVLKQFVQSVPSIVMFGMILVSAAIIWCFPNSWEKRRKLSPISCFTCSILFVWALFSLSGVSAFLYFNF